MRILVKKVTCTDGPQAMDTCCKSIMAQLEVNLIHTRGCLRWNAWVAMQAPSKLDAGTHLHCKIQQLKLRDV